MFPFDDATPTPTHTQVWEWISNFIPHVIGHMIIYSCWDLFSDHINQDGVYPVKHYRVHPDGHLRVAFGHWHGNRCHVWRDVPTTTRQTNCGTVPFLEFSRWYRWVLTESWRRHQMEAFSALLAPCAGNSPVPGEFPAQRTVTRSFDVKKMETKKFTHTKFTWTHVLFYTHFHKDNCHPRDPQT